MSRDALHQPLAQAAPAMGTQYEHIAQVRHGGKVGDDSSEPNLASAAIVNPEAEGVSNGPFYYLPRDALRPVAVRQELMDHIHTQALAVCADQKLFAPVLYNRGFRAAGNEVFHPNILTADEISGVE